MTRAEQILAINITDQGKREYGYFRYSYIFEHIQEKDRDRIAGKPKESMFGKSIV